MSSNLRIGGLASGMDIDQIVKDLMKVQRVRVDKVKQNKQIAEWQREYYRDLNNSIRSLRDSAFNMKLQGIYLANKATSGNESVVKVSASGAAVEGVYQINVSALAEGAYLTSGKLTTSLLGGDGKVRSLKEQLALPDDAPTELTLKVNGKDVSVNITESIETLAARINVQKIGVQASYDRNLDRLFLVTTATGNEAKISLTDLNDNAKVLFTQMGWSEEGMEATGKNARFTLNGTVLEQPTNKFTITGITYEITGKSPDVNSSVMISVAKNTDAVFNSIKSFVELYNTTIEKINSKLTEEKFKGYLPLTDDQREKLTEDQQKKWEERARSGLLKGDPLLTSVVDKLRSAMGSMVSSLDPKFDTLAEIGIKTSADYTERGKLHVDETKLRGALNNNLTAVMELFTKSSEVPGERGIAARLYDNLVAGMNNLSVKAGSANSFTKVDNSLMGKQIEGYEKDILRWEDKLKRIEDRYWKQFTAMEKALEKMNSQSAWLAQQFSNNR